MLKILPLVLVLGSVVRAEITKTAFVVNNLAETLSRINLETHEVFNDVTNLGLVPNQIVIYGDIGYVVNSESNNIQIIDLESDSILRTIALGDSNNPWNIAFLNDSIAYVTNFESNTVFCINVSVGEVTDTIYVGLSPAGICIIDNKIYVTNTAFNSITYEYGQGTVYVIDATSNSVIDSIFVATNPQSLALDSDGELNIVCTGDYFSEWGKICIIDTITPFVVDTTIDIGGSPGSIAIAPNGKSYLGAGGWVDSGYIYIFDTYTNEILRGFDNPILVGKGVVGVTCDSANNIYSCNFSDNSISVIDSNDMVIYTYNVSNGPQSIVLYEKETGIEDKQINETIVCELFQNRPNPFNQTTEIRYSLKSQSQLSIAIYDLTGSLVRTLVNCKQNFGFYTIIWDGTTNNGKKVQNGTYFCQIKVNDYINTKKVLILR